jgi:hypothetical protein
MPRSIINEVEEEYGEPFWDVVAGYAADGHSVQSTAELLGYASGTPFRRLIARHGVTIQFASAQDSVFQKEARINRRGKCSPQLSDALKKASAANPTYIYLDYKGVTDTLAGHARRLGIPMGTVRNRYRVNKDPAHVFFAGSHVDVPTGKGWASAENKARLSAKIQQ